MARSFRLTLSDVKAFAGACYPSLLHAACKVRSKYSTPHQFHPVYCFYNFAKLSFAIQEGVQCTFQSVHILSFVCTKFPGPGFIHEYLENVFLTKIGTCMYTAIRVYWTGMNQSDYWI